LARIGEVDLFDGSQLGICYLTPAINHDGEGQGHKVITQIPGQFHGVVTADEGGVIQAQLLRECRDFAWLVDSDADELETLRPEFALHAYELRHLLSTRLAPGRPEIHDDDLSLPLPESLCHALCIGKGEREQSVGSLWWCRVPEDEGNASGHGEDRDARQ
jgi:hypothetical protein